jgi:chromosome segregation ATPase
MLEKIQIRGFGANEKLDVEFGPNVTTIVGKNFNGKSWMLRALRWVMLNKPAGDGYINWDCDEAKVRLSIDGRKVVRIRNRTSLNSFRLSGKSDAYVAFGNDVPRDIADVVNASGRVNFQGQHDPPFWFCETAGEVSRQLNSIVNLEVIDSTLAALVSELRDTNTSIRLIEVSLEESITERDALTHVKDVDVELRHVENLQKVHQEDVQNRSRIDEKLKLVAKYASKRENHAGHASDGRSVLAIGDRYVKIANLAEKLSELVKSAQELQDTVKNRPPSIAPLERLRKRRVFLSVQCARLDALIESIEHGRVEKCEAERILKNDKKELDKVVEERCPLCGKRTKKS